MTIAPSTRGDPNTWRGLYRAAISATDPRILEQRVSAAEDAIRIRASALAGQPGSAAFAEKEALEDASYVLRGIRSTIREVA